MSILNYNEDDSSYSYYSYSASDDDKDKEDSSSDLFSDDEVEDKKKKPDPDQPKEEKKETKEEIPDNDGYGGIMFNTKSPAQPSFKLIASDSESSSDSDIPFTKRFIQQKESDNKESKAKDKKENKKSDKSDEKKHEKIHEPPKQPEQITPINQKPPEQPKADESKIKPVQVPLSKSNSNTKSTSSSSDLVFPPPVEELPGDKPSKSHSSTEGHSDEMKIGLPPPIEELPGEGQQNKDDEDSEDLFPEGIEQAPEVENPQLMEGVTQQADADFDDNIHLFSDISDSDDDINNYNVTKPAPLAKTTLDTRRQIAPSGSLPIFGLNNTLPVNKFAQPFIPPEAQPRAVNWLEFQLQDIPNYDPSPYDKMLTTEFTTESLLAYSKQ